MATNQVTVPKPISGSWRACLTEYNAGACQGRHLILQWMRCFGKFGDFEFPSSNCKPVFSGKVLGVGRLSLRAPCSFILNKRNSVTAAIFLNLDPATPQSWKILLKSFFPDPTAWHAPLRKLWHLCTMAQGLDFARLFVTHSGKRSYVSVTPKCPGPCCRYHTANARRSPAISTLLLPGRPPWIPASQH